MYRAGRSALLLSVLVALATAGCGAEAPPNPVDVDAGTDAGATVDLLSSSVTQAGPFTCGHRVLSATYAQPAGLPARTIPVHVWYPSHVAGGDHPVYHAVFTDTQAWEGVPLAPSPVALPVLVHSHGHEGFAGNSARLMCWFASHGWLAVAPEHLGNTISDTPPTLPLSIYFQRPLDVRASLDLVAKPPAGDPLVGRADLAHVAMSGHSFGCYTAWTVAGATFDPASIQAQCASGSVASCTDAQRAVFTTDLSEKRAAVVIPMAEGTNAFFTADGYDAARVPVLMMSGTLNPVGNDAMFAASKGVDLTWVEVTGGCHQLFGLGNTVLGDPACAVLPDEEGFALVNPWVLAYARYHVLADRGAEVSGIVEASVKYSPLVQTEHKGP